MIGKTLLFALFVSFVFLFGCITSKLSSKIDNQTESIFAQIGAMDNSSNADLSPYVHPEKYYDILLEGVNISLLVNTACRESSFTDYLLIPNKLDSPYTLGNSKGVLLNVGIADIKNISGNLTVSVPFWAENRVVNTSVNISEMAFYLAITSDYSDYDMRERWVHSPTIMKINSSHDSVLNTYKNGMVLLVFNLNGGSTNNASLVLENLSDNNLSEGEIRGSRMVLCADAMPAVVIDRKRAYAAEYLKQNPNEKEVNYDEFVDGNWNSGLFQNCYVCWDLNRVG